MKRTTILLLAAAVAAASSVSGQASAGSDRDRATGGGQILVGTRGAGDTIAFTAQGDDAGATGQVQYVDREGGTGVGQTTYHGTVRCLVVAGNAAKIAGVWRNGGNFQLYVEDNGEGANALEADVVVVAAAASDPTCDFEEPGDNDQTALARGNTQVYDAP